MVECTKHDLISVTDLMGDAIKSKDRPFGHGQVESKTCTSLFMGGRLVPDSSSSFGQVFALAYVVGQFVPL